MTLHEFYENPLCGRYADEEMKRLFSDDWKFSTWRRLWVALAESEQALGLPITDEQLGELRAHISDID
jgi:adenylosuccinate lyase